MILNEEVDIGVHSAKDIPGNMDAQITIGAYLKREDVRDSIVTNNMNVKSLDDLPYGSTIGTSSPRRTNYIKNYRPDIKILSIRGNIDTRLKKVKDKKLNSIIIAKAGLNRIKFKHEVGDEITLKIMRSNKVIEKKLILGDVPRD